MTDLDMRRRGFEAQFQHQEELAFRVRVLRNRFLGLWAARQLGIADGAAADAYAKSVVVASIQSPGDDVIVGKLRADLEVKGVDVPEAEIRVQLTRAAARARLEIAERA